MDFTIFANINEMNNTRMNHNAYPCHPDQPNGISRPSKNLFININTTPEYIKNGAIRFFIYKFLHAIFSPSRHHS